MNRQLTIKPQQSGYAKNKAVEEKGLNEIRQRQFQHGTAGSTAATGAGYSGSMAGGPGAVDDRKVGTATGTGGGVYEKPVTRSASGAAGTGTTGGVPVQGNVMNAGVSEPGVGRRGAY